MATLIHHWRLDGDGGDSIGGADLTMPGTESYGAGQIGQAVSLPAGGVASAGNLATANFGATDAFSVAFWARANGGLSEVDLLGKKAGGSTSSADEGWNVYATGTLDDVLIFMLSDGTTQGFFASSTGAITADAWYHVAAVWNGATKAGALYIDGSLVDSTPNTSLAALGSLSNTDDLILHNTGGANGYSFDDVRIYSGVLTADEVAELYAYEGSGGAAMSMLTNRRSRGC